jgi:hypothetical protein
VLDKTTRREKNALKQEDLKREDLEKVAQVAIEESRMVLPGIQALFGFQLIAGFNQRFQELPGAEQSLHYISLILVALAIAIIMTPAAYHRIVEQGTITPFFVRLTSWLVAVAMVPLMIALSLNVYVIGAIVLSAGRTSALVAGALLLVFAALWFVFPFAMQAMKRS